MKILGVVCESDSRETRVAMVPEVVAGLVKDQLLEVVVEEDAGFRSGFSNVDYLAAGATIATRQDVIERSQYLVAINGIALAKEAAIAGKTIIGLFDPFFNQDEIKKSCASGVTLLSLELIPRTSRAQSMDVLSSQANIAGYAAVLMAAQKLDKVVPLMMTAAGTIKPAKALIVGAGVAGLQAISTAKRLGAVVFAYDVRSAVKEQVESLGARFIEIKLNEAGEGSGGYAKALSESSEIEQREKLTTATKDMDIVITTAQIPGRKAPLLLDSKAFSLMRDHSVMVDLAAASGGNVAGSVPNEWVKREHVWLYGADNLARSAPRDASFTFSKNIRALLELVLQADPNMDDQIIRQINLARVI